LRYESTLFGSFTELPILEWNEQIFMIEHHSSKWWQFSANMYRHNPCSQTLIIWAKRYIEAYNAACGRPPSVKGSSKLFNKNGQLVTAKQLGDAATPLQKAEAVRNYLKSNSGIMEITIHDIPSINIPDRNTHKERLLVFDCGFAGGGPRFRGTQYLDLDGSKDASARVMIFSTTDNGKLSQRFIDNTAGYGPPSEAPDLVKNPRAPLFGAGEFL
jgi:hypothetical protein